MASVLAVKNLFAEIPRQIPEEIFEILFQNPHARIERIVSRQHVTLPGQWYDQSNDEWVLLLAGGALLRIDGREELLTMTPGDWILLPAHVRHRVERTDNSRDTIWLSIHVTK